MLTQRSLSQILLIALTLAFPTLGSAEESTKKPEYPPLSKVIEGFTEVKTADGSTPFIRVWRRSKDNQLIAQLPADYSKSTHRQFFATTVSSGERFAGLQADDHYVFWRKYGKRLALIRENLDVRGSDSQSKDSVNRIFTDQVMLDVPILTMQPRQGPVIDLDALLVGNASTFFGPRYRASRNLVSIKKAKVFKKNIEIALEVPMSGGELKTLHYSISKIEGSPGYKPRPADQRVGYFTTGYDDYGQYDRDDPRVRMINRWHLEKRDPKLKLSPPKQPIVFYIEHTTPVRYRRWVREGVLYWNKAFEKVGILDAIEVRMQDKQSNLYMDADPEDVQYNFIRWLNNNISTAIGPSRVNPITGEILDADIVLTDGWIRVFESQFDKEMPKVSMQGVTPETLAWFADHPNWDPRIRMAAPGQREYLRQEIAKQAAMPQTGHANAKQQTRMMGDESIDGLIGRTSQVNGNCLAAEGRRYDVAMMRMMTAFPMPEDSDKPKKKKRKKKKKEEEEDEDSVASSDDEDDEDSDDEDEDEDEEKDDEDEEEEDEDEKEESSDEQILDGMPESFIGPLLADLVAHEVGHTLGLRHNFKASSVYTLEEINSAEHRGKKTIAGSVMDYLPTNFNFKSGKQQGDYAMIGVGPYDMWAIEYGYTLDKSKLPKILKRVSEPELAFCTDQDTLGPDPMARRYDFSKNPLDFAKNQVRLAKYHRGRILEDFVEEGDSWSKARQGYLLTLRMQTKATSMMANWIGGTSVRFDHKGDPGDRKPIEVIPTEDQRAALDFVLENTMKDEAFGLTPELLDYMVSSGWRDGGFFSDGPTWPIHDRVGSVQAAALSSLMNPTVLRRVYDNEFRADPKKDMLTLNELLNKVSDSIWTEIDDLDDGDFDERNPAISSLRRNLQAEHLQRLFDLANNRSNIAAMKPISNLAKMKLSKLQKEIESASKMELDPYTTAHLVDSNERIKKWIESLYVTNQG